MTPGLCVRARGRAPGLSRRAAKAADGRRGLFQSSSGPKTGCNDQSAYVVWALREFQSSSGPKTGCNPPWRRVVASGHRVSILIRPEDRMQLSLMAVIGVPLWFQSSSGPKTGCNRCGVSRCRTASCFNPHPARRPDATRGRPLPHAGLRRVSILIRPEDRMQRSRGHPPLAGTGSFNPHPARRPDATGVVTGQLARQHVSILIRPEDRMQLSLPGVIQMLIPFQSSSGPKTGCNPVLGWQGHPPGRFNPHPARRPDATRA